MRWLRLLLACLVLPVCAWAEDCSKCKGIGRVSCKSHDELNVGGVKVGDFVCADCLDLPCCHGMGWMPCPKCKSAKGQEDWDKAHQEALDRCKQLAEAVEKKWIGASDCTFVRERKAREKGKKKEQAVPREFVNLLETPHVIFATDMPGRRVKTKSGVQVLDAHQSQHLYLGRFLEVFQDVVDLHRPDAFEAKKASKKEALEVPALRGVSDLIFIFANEEAQRRLTARLFDSETSGPISAPGAVAVWEDSISFAQDTDLHHYVYGALSRSLIHQYNDDPARTSEERKKDESLPAWLTHGFQYALEMRRWGECLEAGVQEAKKSAGGKGVEGWNAHAWPKAVASLVAKGKDRPFAEISRMGLDDMQCSDLQVSWSYVEFLMRKGMDKLADLTPKLRKPGNEQGQALREVYGMTQAELEEAWTAFAKKQ